MIQCVLLNADYSFLNVTTWKRAMGLVVKSKVQVLKYSKKTVRTAEGALIKIPVVMKLVKLIKTLYRIRVPFSKKNLLIRDRFKCSYCGNNKERLTIDHIVPKSRGGNTSFENCVACCKPCNNKKGGQTPKEANMHLLVKAYQPTIAEFLRLKVGQTAIYDLLKDSGIY